MGLGNVDNISLLEIFNRIYPVGAIYISTNNVNPNILFGGTWERLKDRFLLGCGDTYKTMGATGGESSHTLTSNEMPSHSHTFTGNNLTGGIDAVWSANDNSSGVLGKTRRTDVGGIYGVGSAGACYNLYLNATPSGENGFAGGGAAHNNMPPYLVVNMWQRIS